MVLASGHSPAAPNDPPPPPSSLLPFGSISVPKGSLCATVALNTP